MDWDTDSIVWAKPMYFSPNERKKVFNTWLLDQTENEIISKQKCTIQAMQHSSQMHKPLE